MDSLIPYMIEAKECLEKITASDQTPEYANILSQINIFLLNFCKHEIIVDSIDITPDRSCCIKYCNKCFVTLL